MKDKTAWTIVVVCVAVLAGLILLSGCATEEQRAGYDDLMATYERIVADGVITPAERADLEMKARGYGDKLHQTDWMQLFGTAAGSVLLSFFGVNA